MDVFRDPIPVLVNRDLLVRPPPLPQHRIRALTDLSTDLSKRSNSDSSSSSSSFSSSNTDTSNNSGGSDTTPIVIGVVVPVLIIAIILFVIWRRRQRITKVEEANDKYRSLDFGVDESQIREKGRKKHVKTGPEMSIAELKGTLNKNRGISVDLGANPYILPPELHQSRESLHSLSRSINTGDDKYRATNFIPDDGSLRSPSSLRSHGDNASMLSGITRHRTGTNETESKMDLLPRPPLRHANSEDSYIVKKPSPVADKQQPGLLVPTTADHDRNSTLSTVSKDGNVAALRASNTYLGQYIRGGQQNQEVKTNGQSAVTTTQTEVQVTPPHEEPREIPAISVQHESPQMKRQSSFYDHGVAELADNNTRLSEFDFGTKVPTIETTTYEVEDTSASVNSSKSSPQENQHTSEIGQTNGFDTNNYSTAAPEPVKHTGYHNYDDEDDYYDEEGFEEYADYLGYTYRGSMMGMRPLPPDDPSENPEQRANRIRSFYKEYFDDGNTQKRQNNAYFDGSEQYDDFDYGYYEQSHSRGYSIRSDGRHRAYSHGNSSYYARPRAYSSMSGRMGPRPRIPKKNLPPPKPLMVLPTPGKLKDDDFLPNAIDYAPPQVYRNQRAGTPDSRHGGLRPYTPSVRPHVPLTSSFDDLAVIPSPHSLRKSGTFTGLDFAPPRRFKGNGDSMSETGSIRSNRSNLSKMQVQSIRNGAYRVSRIPKDVAGTRDDMYAALRPKWDMRGDGSASGAGAGAHSMTRADLGRNDGPFAATAGMR